MLVASGCGGSIGASVPTGADRTSPTVAAPQRALESVLYSFGGGDITVQHIQKACYTAFPAVRGARNRKPASRSTSTAVIYGTTMYGGNYLGYCSGGGCGTVFKLTPGPSGHTESIAYAFQGSDGNLPFGVPTIDEKNGTIYGTTYLGRLAR